MNLAIKVNLTKIPGAHYIDLPGKNGPTKCIVMPVENCNLFVGEKGVYLDLTAFQLKEQRFGDSHFLKQSIGKDAYNALTKEQQDALPIIGGVKDIAPKQMDTVASAEFMPEAAEGSGGEEGTGLPF